MNALHSAFFDRSPGFDTSIIAFAAAGLIYTVITVLDRLVFGPLAGFPGPKLAALTGYYETYFDCVQSGRYWVEIQRMHEEYGPIVRISPREIHVNDPDFNEPYKVSSRPSKDHWFYSFVGSSDAAFGTEKHDLHRVRRGAQSGYFTAAHVESFDRKLESLVEKLMTRLRDFKESGQPANLSDAYRCLAADVVQAFAFHESYDLLRSPDFAANYNRTSRNFPRIGMWHRHFGYILGILQAMPLWLVVRLDPDGADVVRKLKVLDNGTEAIVKAWDGDSSISGHEKVTKKEDANIIHQMLDSQELPAKDKSSARLALEMKTIVGAGTETTGNTLQAITFFLLRSPEKAAILRDELRATQKKAGSVQLRYTALQKLPYLSAVIMEGHRISSSVAGRLPRLNPHTSIKYKGWSMPAGTVVSTTQKLIHDNPTIFPNPREFSPERWLDPAEKKRLEKYLQPFGRGTRTCLGLHLANSELYVTIARLFSTFEMELFETTEKEVDQYNDYFSPFPESLKGVRVILK